MSFPLFILPLFIINQNTFQRLIGPPKTYFLSSLLMKGEVPIYKKLYENNMDGENLFYPHSIGVKHLINDPKVTLMEVGDNVRSANNQPCKIKSVWKSSSPLYTYSMYLEKNSPLTPFIAHEIRKLTEFGISNILFERFKSTDPTCKPILAEGTSLSLKKIASLFVLFFTSIFVSFLILTLEQLISHYLPQKIISMPRAGNRLDINFKITKFIRELRKNESGAMSEAAREKEMKKAVLLLQECRHYLEK